jgi:hypothetical protein
MQIRRLVLAAVFAVAGYFAVTGIIQYRRDKLTPVQTVQTEFVEQASVAPAAQSVSNNTLQLRFTDVVLESGTATQLGKP